MAMMQDNMKAGDFAGEKENDNLNNCGAALGLETSPRGTFEDEWFVLLMSKLAPSAEFLVALMKCA